MRIFSDLKKLRASFILHKYIRLAIYWILIIFYVVTDDIIKVEVWDVVDVGECPSNFSN